MATPYTTHHKNITVTQPDLDAAVFCRVLQDIGDFLLPGGGNESIHMERGNIYILRYRAVRDLLAEGKVELL
jgi:GINS complex subunit 4